MKKEIIVCLPGKSSRIGQRGSLRNRENYKEQVRKLTNALEAKEKENSDLRRRLANVEEYCRRALA